MQEYAIIHNKSFIDFRRSGGIVGPEAIFSRYNLSINMTRSIGDKYAARCVIPLPEVTALTISRDEFARFIIASDGVWDVLSPEQVGELGCRAHLRDEAAMVVAEEARRIRLLRRMRMDDISVIVIDVNSSRMRRGGKATPTAGSSGLGACGSTGCALS